MVKCYTFRIDWKEEFDYFQFFEEYHGRMKVCNSVGFEELDYKG